MTKVPTIIIEHTYNGQRVDFSPLITTVRWSGDIMQASRKLEVELNNTLDGKVRSFWPREGAEIVFKYRNIELFRGVLFSDKINDKGVHRFTAYDENTYLVRNTDTIKLGKETASKFITRICTKFGIAVGTIDNTGYIIQKMIFRDETLWDMFIMALTETRKRTGKVFVISCEKGKLCLRERKKNATQWILENGVNILSAEYARSIEDTSTQVKVMGTTSADKEIVATVKDTNLIKLYGTMQHLESVSGDTTQAEINALAKELLKQLATLDDSAGIVALGQPDVIAGKCVYVKESMTRIVGGYYVTTDRHEFFGDYHEMIVTLSATDELPKMSFDFSNND